jgi:Malectin domain
LEFVTRNNEVPFVNGIEIAPSQQGAIRPIRFLARDLGYTDRTNRFWSSDRYFHSGVQVQRHDPVANTEEETLYQNERFGNFSYTIPVAQNSRYTVTMKFCESWFGLERPAGGGAGKRVFDVSFNGRVLLSNFDVFKEAGSLRALDKTFKGLEPNAQGKLIFTFAPSHNYAMVDAIEVVDEGWK